MLVVENLTKFYPTVAADGSAGMLVSNEGAYVRFSDVMDVFSTAHNSASKQCPICKRKLYTRKVTYCMNDMCNYVEVDRSQLA
jgi:hypothetical protein